jgi:hypothetical protein
MYSAIHTRVDQNFIFSTLQLPNEIQLRLPDDMALGKDTHNTHQPLRCRVIVCWPLNIL